MFRPYSTSLLNLIPFPQSEGLFKPLSPKGGRGQWASNMVISALHARHGCSCNERTEHALQFLVGAQLYYEGNMIYMGHVAPHLWKSTAYVRHHVCQP